MNEDRKKPGVAFWATVVVVAVLVAYPLSIGPACWVADHSWIGKEIVAMIYTPAIWCSANGPAPIAAAVNWWAHLYCKNEWNWGVGTDGKYHWIHFIRLVEPSGSM